MENSVGHDHQKPSDHSSKLKCLGLVEGIIRNFTVCHRRHVEHGIRVSEKLLCLSGELIVLEVADPV